MPNIIDKLNSNEYAPFYKGYLEKVEDGDVITMMINDLESQLNVLENIDEEQYSHSYSKGKWSIAELILHVSDTESVFSYRALSFARKDKTHLPGFEQNDWADQSKAEQLSKDKIIGLFKTTRNHSIALFKSFNEQQLNCKGTASNAPFSVRALAYLILGHGRHHFEVLNNNYLS